MGTAKRERQKAGRQARLEEARKAQKQAETRKRFTSIAIFALVFVAIVGILAFLRRDDGKPAEQSTSGSTAPTTTSPAGTLLPLGASITGPTPCPPTDGSATRTTSFAEAPPMCIDPNKTYTAQVATTAGDFTIALDATKAPMTVNNFVVLSRYKFYDGVPFHRVIPGFVVQGGDATGNPAGTGSPGYTVNDELPAAVAEYVPGSVAMANSGPNTNGSQFFIWTGPNPLPGPQYSLFGKVTEGYDTTVKAISDGGSPSGTPTKPVTIETITITES